MAKKRGESPKTLSKKKVPTTKKKNSKKKTAFKVIFSSLVVIMLVAVISYLVYAFSIAQTLNKVDNSNFWLSKMAINIYDRDDELLDSTDLVDYVDLKDDEGNLNVSPYYVNGIIDTEDSKFPKHNGVDFIGMVKGVIQTIFTNTSRGASTITMQLAKLVYMSDWEVYNDDGYTKKQLHPIEYKTTQMAYAMKIENNFSKEEIMENYINTVYFGNGAGYGVGNAAKYYFNKKPNELSIAEAALLAGIPQSPNNYDPFIDAQAATERRNVVLGRLLHQKDITQTEYDEAINSSVTDSLVKATEKEQEKSQANIDYIDLVLNELLDKYHDEEDFNLTTSGIDVYTNLDQDLQEQTYKTLSTNEKVTMEQNELQAGTATIDSQTGAVLAIGGGRNDQDLLATNYAFTELHQPGSTAKPIVDYGPAIEFLDWSTHHKIVDKQIFYDDGPEVNNWDDQYKGDMTLQKALAQSRNTTALSTFKTVSNTVGINKMIDFLKGLGITDLKLDQADSIGGFDEGTTPLELAGAYATFANGGIYHKPSAIRYVEINQNSPLYEKYGDRQDFMDKGKRAMKEETAYMITKMLDPKNGDASGVGEPAASGLKDESLKTGTTNWPADATHDSSEVRDKWVAGYTPDVTTVVWTGFDYQKELDGMVIDMKNHDSYKIYQSIMQGVKDSSAKYLHDDKYTKPSKVKEVSVKENKWPAVEDSSGKKYYFIEGSDDYKEIKKEPNLIRPSIKSVNVTATKVKLKWTGSTTGSKYVVKIDGKNYKTVKSKSISIPISDLSRTAGCKTEYPISVQATLNGKVSATSTGRVEFSSTSFCKNSDKSASASNSSSNSNEVASASSNSGNKQTNNTSKDKNDTSKDKNDTSKDKNDTSKDKNDASKDKNDASKDKNDASKDKNDASKDKDDSNSSVDNGSDTNTDSNNGSNTNTDSNNGSDTNTDSNNGSDTNTDSNNGSDTNTDGNNGSDTNTDSNNGSDTNTDGNNGSDTNTDSNNGSNANADTNASGGAVDKNKN